MIEVIESRLQLVTEAQTNSHTKHMVNGKSIYLKVRPQKLDLSVLAQFYI